MFAYRSAYYLERMKFDDPDDEAERAQKLEAARNELEVRIAKSAQRPDWHGRALLQHGGQRRAR